jgi:hypothetical protein
MTREWNGFYATGEDMLLPVGVIVKQSATGFAKSRTGSLSLGC